MSKKRANNEGTIRQHASGFWEARFTAGYDAAGKQIRKSLYANTKEEVGKRLREALRALERVEFVEPADMTVAEWLDTWFKVYGRPRWRDSTAAEHYRNIQQNLNRSWGGTNCRGFGMSISRTMSINKHPKAEPVQASKNELNPCGLP